MKHLEENYAIVNIAIINKFCPQADRHAMVDALNDVANVLEFEEVEIDIEEVAKRIVDNAAHGDRVDSVMLYEMMKYFSLLFGDFAHELWFCINKYMEDKIVISKIR